VKTKPAQGVFGQRNVNVTNRRLQTNVLPTKLQCKHLCFSIAKWRTGHENLFLFFTWLSCKARNAELLALGATLNPVAPASRQRSMLP
jgi:hypothetical protein